MRRRGGPTAVARPGRGRSAPGPAAVSPSLPFVAARAPARRASYSAANACGLGQLHLALGDARPPGAHHVPVRRFRSRLRPFLRVTRHSQARGAPSWRAIPRTSAELMASTTAGTLRCATCGCRRSSCARVMFATLTVPASLHATAAAQCVSSFLRVSVTVSSSRRLPALHFCGPQPGAWRPFRAQGPWLCLLPLVPVARCWLALHSPTSRRHLLLGYVFSTHGSRCQDPQV